MLANNPIFKIHSARAAGMQTNSYSTNGKLQSRVISSLVISAFALISIIFVPIGVASLLASRDVPKLMKQPIYVYYQLDNFYQNHRRYVKSRSDEQLLKPAKQSSTSTCEPEDKTADGAPIVPCGLIAWSLFNDTYTFTNKKKALTVNKKDISWKSDREHKFGSDVFPKNFQKGMLIGGGKLDPDKPLSEQEDLIVWMRTAALPTFRKLYGKIEEDLEANDVLTVTLENNYNTYSFGGQKRLVLSTTSWMGGKNDFIGVVYLTVGGLCFFLATAFTIIYLLKPRQLGDPSYLSWNKNPAGH
ncbi:ALA-interacting subunit 1 [Asimina triloba]